MHGKVIDAYKILIAESDEEKLGKLGWIRQMGFKEAVGWSVLNLLGSWQRRTASSHAPDDTPSDFINKFYSNILDVQYFGFRSLKITPCSLQLLMFADMELLLEYFLTITFTSEKNISQNQIYVALNSLECVKNVLISPRNLFQAWHSSIIALRRGIMSVQNKINTALLIIYCCT
jgi:hypothetical protein